MISGVKVFIKNEALGKYLFVLRDDNPNIPEPNRWSLVGGGIEKDETPSDALKREVLEEINVPIFDLQLIHQMTIENSVNGKEFNVHGYYFLAKTNASLDEITLTEGQKAFFFTLEEFSRKKNVCIGSKEIILNHRNLLE